MVNCLVESPDLKTGVIFAIFQTECTVDVLIDKLIIYARGSTIISVQSLSRPARSFSTLGAICLFRALSSFSTNLLDMLSTVKSSFVCVASVLIYRHVKFSKGYVSDSNFLTAPLK